MKLYLSSYRVPTPEALQELLGQPFNSVKVAIIPNAKDDKPNDEREAKIAELNSDLQAFGFATSLIDLRSYNNSEKLHVDLKANHLLWLAGGNTFMLRWQMKRCGFDQIIGQLLDEGSVYAGESAGAIIAGVTLKGAEHADGLETVPEIIWEGIGLVNNILVPHADSSEYSDYVTRIEKLYKSDERLLKLNDNQALVVNGSSQKLTTATHPNK